MMLVNPYAVQPAAGGGAVNPTFGNVKLLLHGEGTAGTQTYTDNSSYARTLTGNGNCLVSTAQSYRGSSSINISGGVNWSVPRDATIGADEWARMGTDAHPLTLELALRMPAISVASIAGSDGAGWWQINLLASATGIELSDNGNTQQVLFGTPLSANTWYALAVAVRGTAHREFGVWLNGVWQGSIALTSTPRITNNGNQPLNLTRASGTNQFVGFWDELRISEELFLPWGSNYTPLAGAFPDS
jgi:hypothetical protein